MGSLDNYLVISDLQIPFQAPRALEFCLYAKKQFKVPDENILCVGDEVDQYFGSLYKKDPDATHTPNSEIKATKDELRRWYRAFPLMKIAESNHGMRWAKKAAEAEIPSQMLRRYQEVLEAPPGWQWKPVWKINARRKPFLLKHGMEYGGLYPYRNAPFIESISVAFGHLHSTAGIAYVRTEGLDAWGMCVGSLVDVLAYAFKYGKFNKFKPNLTIGAVIDGGRMPILLPYE